MRICFTEENDREFIRWTSNLLRTFLNDGRVKFVGRNESPELLIASVWRPHDFPEGLPVILITNECWSLFKPHAPLTKYKAVLGVYPPQEPCTFIRYSYAAIHFDVPVDRLYRMRQRFLNVAKTEFCCFVVSGMAGVLAGDRLLLMNRINAWKPVHSAGKLLNNVGYFAPRGMEFLDWISRYKYMICLENSRERGYITEKPFQAWFAGAIPIYDGGSARDSNPAAIVNASTDDVLKQIKRLEARPDYYETKRLANLTEKPLSMESFEENFRNTVLEPAVIE